jgi:hypothetical protein
MISPTGRYPFIIYCFFAFSLSVIILCPAIRERENLKRCCYFCPRKNTRLFTRYKTRYKLRLKVDKFPCCLGHGGLFFPILLMRADQPSMDFDYIRPRITMMRYDINRLPLSAAFSRCGTNFNTPCNHETDVVRRAESTRITTRVQAVYIA